MLALNGVMNVKEFMTTKQSSNSEGGNGKDFMQIFQSKVQPKHSGHQKPFSTMSNHIKPTDNKASNTTGNILEKQNKPLVYDEGSVGKLEETSKEGENKPRVNVEEENLSKEPLLLEIEEETLQQYECIIPPQLLLHLEELITILEQQGYITKDEAETIMIELEGTTNQHEGILKLNNLFNELNIKNELQNLQIDNLDGIKSFEKTVKSILNDVENQSLDDIDDEQPKIHNSININQGYVEKLTEEDTAAKEEKPLEKALVEKAVEYQNTDKPVKVNNYEKSDTLDPHVVVDLSKSFDLKLNNITDQSLNTEEIHGKNLMEQLIHKVEGTYKAGKTQLKLQLMPENLGKLSINLSSENQIIKAKIYVESLQVKEIIENNLNQFKESLREKGLNISSVEVSVGQDSEAFLQNRSFAQQKLKSKKASSSIDKSLVGIQEMNSITNINPYLVSEGFDKLG